MNKQDLKSLLENIYTALTEQNPPPLPPRLSLPDGPTGPPPTPTPKPRLKPPVVTPVPPKPKPTPTPDNEPIPRDITNPYDPRNPFRLPNPPPPKPLSPGEQRIRDALRELGIEHQFPDLFN